MTVLNRMGMHTRPAAMLVQCASSFRSEINIHKDDECASCRSILGLMMLSAGCGTKLKVTAEGSDSEEAMKAVVALFHDKFGEE